MSCARGSVCSCNQSGCGVSMRLRNHVTEVGGRKFCATRAVQVIT